MLLKGPAGGDIFRANRKRLSPVRADNLPACMLPHRFHIPVTDIVKRRTRRSQFILIGTYRA